VGTDRVEVPRERADSVGRVPGTGHDTLVGTLASNRLLVIISFVVLLIVGVIIALATDNWWAVVAACGVHAAGTVIVGTLVLQGVTLPAVARWLRIPGDDPKDDALAEASAQQAAARAAGARLDAEAQKDGDVPEAVMHRLRGLLTDRTNLAWERLGGRRRETPSETYSRLRRAMIEEERGVFRKARDEGRIPEEVLRRAQRDLDLEESLLEREND